MFYLYLAISVILYSLISGFTWPTLRQRLFKHYKELDNDILNKKKKKNNLRLLLLVIILFLWIIIFIQMKDYLPISKKQFLIILIFVMFTLKELITYFWNIKRAIESILNC